MGNIERWSEDELKRTLVAADGIDAEGFGATAGVLRELVFEIRRLRTTNRGAVDDLAKIGHAFLAYEYAPFADQGEYRAELLAVLREVVNRHAGGQ